MPLNRLHLSLCVQFLEPMLTLIAKDELTDEEVLKCQQIVYNLIAFEARHEPLTLPIGHLK